MDKTLEDIISSNKPRRKVAARRSSGRSQILGAPVASPTNRARAAAAVTSTNGAAAVVTSANTAADKIIVSNLPADVNETQIKELFHSTVGPLKDVTLHYDSAGRSKGVASVHFQRKGDGTKAYQQYNNRLIDGS
ncbi:hypothetical protein AX15_004405 [Amanita polypyramis BW_CC]|nr:hypothetical protein AX15_004405 [Amanita polypyramis BW_CC]